MDVQSLVAQARDALSVERVFGTPYEKDGIAVVPVANVRGGGGGGGGPTGGGGGGLQAGPAAPLVLPNGSVRRQPVAEVHRVLPVPVVTLRNRESNVSVRAKSKRARVKAS